ncbi:MAG: diguanylate cyclase [Pseudomonadota bacterium]
MMATADHDNAIPADELERRLLQIMFKHTPTASVGALLVFLIDLYLYREALPGAVLIAWGALFALAFVARFWIYGLYLRSPERLAPSTYRWLFTGCVALHGIAWTPLIHGALSLDEASMHIYAVLSVTGMAGASLGSMAAWRSMFAAFVAPFAVATLSTVDLASGQWAGTLALWTVFFGFIFMCSRVVNTTLVDAVRSRLRNEELANELRRLAERDPLTGLYNRRRFEDELESAWVAAERRDRRVGVLIGDVDHFKAYNDTLGHQAGDECLQQVANVLKDLHRRGEGVPARLGGEEFVVLLREVQSDTHLKTVAERIRQGLEDEKLTHPASPLSQHVTMSVGAATAAPGDEHASMSMLLELADQALYRAKQAGRNQTMVIPTVLGESSAERPALNA